MEKVTQKHRYFMIAAAFTLVAAVFGVLFFSYMRSFDRTMTEENRSQLSEVSGHIATYLQYMVQEQQDELAIVADAYALIPDPAEQAEYLDRNAKQLRFEYIGVAGKDGMLYAEAFPAPKDISGETYFRGALDGEPSISGLTRHIFSDRVVSGVIMAVPVPDQSQRVVVAMLDTSTLGENIRVDSFGGEGYSYIIDQDGEPVLNSRSREFNNLFQSLQNMEFEDGFSLRELEEDIRARKEGMAAYSDLGVAKYVYYRPLDINGWTVVSTVPKGVITDRTRSLSRNLVVLCAGAMLVFLGLFIVVAVLYLRLERRRQANQARSAFLANMSHDMRTPMNAIVGMAAIADTHADEPETVRGCMRKITSSSKHLLGLISDILDMSKIESGKLELSREAMSLAEVLGGTIDLTYPQMRDKNQHFSVRLHGVAHERFYGDSLRLRQVFVNILTNASKFTQEGGRITVDVEEQPSKAADTAQLSFSFTDNGIGMKPEFLKHIFSAFTRERDSKVDKIEGSGLGMSISKRLVDLMGGSITVASEEGKGSTFTVSLSLPLDLNPLPEPGLPPCRVMVVDDDDVRGPETVRTLQAIGVRGEWTADGLTAAARLSEAYAAGDGYRMVLLERALFEAGELKPIQAAASPNLIYALAALDWEDIRSEAAAAGIRHFLQRPLFRSTLLRCLNEAVFGETPADSGEEKKADFTGKTILLVDDNELNLEIAQLTLIETGAATVCARNGKECLALFMDAPVGHFDLILMDIQMPEMNGYEATRRIRKLERPDASVPIIAMSANAFAEDMMAAQEAGMSGYLTKPIDIAVWMKEIGKQIT